MAQSKEDFNILSNGPILAAANSNIWSEIRDIAIPEDNPYRK
jgi:hypothetical protein